MKHLIQVGSICLGILCFTPLAWAQKNTMRAKVERTNRRTVAVRYIKAKKDFLQHYHAAFGKQGFIVLYASTDGPSLRGHTTKRLQLHVSEKAALACWNTLRQISTAQLQEEPPYTKEGEVPAVSYKASAKWQLLPRDTRMLVRVRLDKLPGILADINAPRALMDAFLKSKAKPAMMQQVASLVFCPQVKDSLLRAQWENLPAAERPHLEIDAQY